MSFRFPYTNFQELNLDWIVKKVKDLSKQIESDSSIVSEYIDRLLAVEEKADNAEATATAADARATGANTTANSALTLATQAKQTADIADLSTTLLGLKIGDLSSLFTTAKDTIVNAINEVWGIFHNATAVTNVTPAGTDPAVTYSNGVFTFDLPEGGDPDAVTQAELDAAIDGVEDTIDALSDRVDGLEDSIDELSEELDNKADVIIDTASGDIAEFPDGTATPLKALVVNIEPVQAGSGDPSPNNVRPINGWTGLNLWRTGENLLCTDGNNLPLAARGITFSYVNGEYIVQADADKAGYPFAKIGQVRLKAGTYILNINQVNGLGIRLVDRNIDPPAVIKSSAGSPVLLTVTDEITPLLDIDITSTAANVPVGTHTLHPMLNIGNTAQSYVPYKGNLIPVTWENEAGTIYGGTLDVLSGVLTVMKAYSLLNDVTKWSIFTSDNINFIYNVSFARKIYDNSFTGLICSTFKTQLSGNLYGRWRGANSPFFGIYDSDGALTLEQIQEMAEDNEIAICYDIEPVTYQLTPQQVEALKGYNAIWSDAGSVDVTYRADTKGYIDKLIAQVQALALGG